MESALKLLGVPEGASFDDILRAKNSIVKACKDDQEAIAQVLFLCHGWSELIISNVWYSVDLDDFSVAFCFWVSIFLVICMWVFFN